MRDATTATRQMETVAPASECPRLGPSAHTRRQRKRRGEGGRMRSGRNRSCRQSPIRTPIRSTALVGAALSRAVTALLTHRMMGRRSSSATMATARTGMGVMAPAVSRLVRAAKITGTDRRAGAPRWCVGTARSNLPTTPKSTKSAMTATPMTAMAAPPPAQSLVVRACDAHSCPTHARPQPRIRESLETSEKQATPLEKQATPLRCCTLVRAPE